MAKVAAIQMCSSFNVNENLEHAANLVNDAAKNGAKLIVLPEMFAILGRDAVDKVAVKEPIHEGKIQTALKEMAKKNRVWIVGGTIPLAAAAQHKVRAATLVFNAEGQPVARYDKIHLFDVTLKANERYKESDTVEPGDQIVVVDTPFGKLGLAVCYDIRFPALFHALLAKGAEIIAIPAAFTVLTGEAHWKLLARARAVENFCYVVGACQGGVHANGRQTYGHSLIVEPWGQVIAEKTEIMPGVIYATIDLEKVYAARRAIPIKEHRQNFLNN